MVSLTSASHLLLIVLLCHGTSSVTNKGEKCRTTRCAQDRGFIAYDGNERSNLISWSITKNRYAPVTTFIVHVKDIGTRNHWNDWLEITQIGHRTRETHRIRGNDERLLVFEETSEVQVRIINFSIERFRLSFFTGCEVLQGRNVTLTRSQPEPATVQSSAHRNQYYNYYRGFYGRLASYSQYYPQSQRQATSCWLVIPVVENGGSYGASTRASSSYRRYPTRQRRIEQDVEEMFLALKSVNLQNNSCVQVNDLITGDNVMTLRESSEIEAMNLNKTNKIVTYNGQSRVSAAVLIDLRCDNDPQCGKTDFIFKAVAIRRSDLDCIEREQKCRLNLGPGNFDCTPPSGPPIAILLSLTLDQIQTTECAVFNYIDSIVDTTDTSNATGDILRRNGRRLVEQQLSRCAEYLDYCSGIQCIKFQRKGCHLACFAIKHQMRMCSYFNSIFA